jgi:hypothetical protein
MGITEGKINREVFGRVRIAAPVQTEASGWWDYLSDNEHAEYNHANKHSRRGSIILFFGTCIFWGCNILFSATVAGPLAMGLGMAMGLGVMTYGFGKQTINISRAYSLEKEATRREGDIVVMRRHGITPKGPQT